MWSDETSRINNLNKKIVRTSSLPSSRKFHISINGKHILLYGFLYPAAHAMLLKLVHNKHLSFSVLHCRSLSLTVHLLVELVTSLQLLILRQKQLEERVLADPGRRGVVIVHLPVDSARSFGSAVPVGPVEAEAGSLGDGTGFCLGDGQQERGVDPVTGRQHGLYPLHLDPPVDRTGQVGEAEETPHHDGGVVDGTDEVREQGPLDAQHVSPTQLVRAGHGPETLAS